MARENYELRVGFFVLGAGLLLASGWGWLKNALSFDPPQVFWVRFHDVSGLSNNATVNVQGVRVGTVDQITFKLQPGVQDAPDADARAAKLPKVYTHIKIAGLKMPIPKDAEVTIQTLGMVGAKYIEITLPTEPAEHSEAMDPNLVVEGKDPVRVELVINNIAKKLNQAADTISSDEAANALKHISAAAEKLDKNLDKMPGISDSLKKASDSITVTAGKFGKTADRTEQVALNANRFFSEGKTSFDSVSSLANGLSQTNKKVGKILDNPAMSKDLKETVQLAHKTAEAMQSAIAELSGTVKDKELRQDMLSMLSKIQTSSEGIRQSMQVVNKLADDQGLRSDVKTAMTDAREAMTKANTMLSDPGFKTDVTLTMSKVRTAATDVDIAAQQLHQILEKRNPLFHMMFGDPGKLSKTKETLHDGTSVNNNSSNSAKFD